MNLDGLGIKGEFLDTVRKSSSVLFSETFSCKMKEAYILYEQGILDEELIFDLCNKEYDVELLNPIYTYIPKNILAAFSNQNAVPLKYDFRYNKITVGTIPEYRDILFTCGNFDIEVVYIPIYKYINIKKLQNGKIPFLYKMPVKLIFETIISEALQLEASEIIVSNQALGSCVVYNCRKRRVKSKQTLTYNEMEELVKHIANSGGQAISDLSIRKPRYLSIDIDINHRGRVVINKTFYGFKITIRILPNELLNSSLEDLNISYNTCEFLRNVVLSEEKGLRLFIGETFSGKNTTILATLNELVITGKYNIVSIEQPVELLVDGIDQIDTETEEEFSENSDSLLRQNPDIVYFTEITQRTAEFIIKQSNTSKSVFSSVHANSISDVISRICDITNLTPDRVIQTIQSCVYQKLIRDNEKDSLYPINVCVHFTQELKEKLYGKTMPEVINILRKEESSWVS